MFCVNGPLLNNVSGHLLGQLADVGAFADVLPEEVARADMHEPEVPDDPVRNGALAGAGSPDDEGAQTRAVTQALKMSCSCTSISAHW
jgi:hypothetical protein